MRRKLMIFVSFFRLSLLRSIYAKAIDKNFRDTLYKYRDSQTTVANDDETWIPTSATRRWSR